MIAEGPVHQRNFDIYPRNSLIILLPKIRLSDPAAGGHDS